jgi:hypothetical protein
VLVSLPVVTVTVHMSFLMLQGGPGFKFSTLLSMTLLASQLILAEHIIPP